MRLTEAEQARITDNGQRVIYYPTRDQNERYDLRECPYGQVGDTFGVSGWTYEITEIGFEQLTAELVEDDLFDVRSFAAEWDGRFPSLPFADEPWVWVIRFTTQRTIRRSTQREAYNAAIAKLTELLVAGRTVTIADVDYTYQVDAPADGENDAESHTFEYGAPKVAPERGKFVAVGTDLSLPRVTTGRVTDEDRIEVFSAGDRGPTEDWQNWVELVPAQ